MAKTKRLSNKRRPQSTPYGDHNRGARPLVEIQTTFPRTKAVTADARYNQCIISPRRVRFSGPSQGPKTLFSLASKTVSLFSAEKREMGLAPRGQRDLRDPEGPAKPSQNARPTRWAKHKKLPARNAGRELFHAVKQVLTQTSSTMAISAASPRRGPVRTTRV